jgi:hypothetical protein
MSTSPGDVAKLERRRRLLEGAPVRVESGSSGGFIDSVSVQAIKADKRSEILDSFYRIKLDVTRNKSYLDV